MKREYRAALVLLAAVLLLSLCGCGGNGDAYRVIETVGEKQYGTVFRLGDRAEQYVSAAMDVLAAEGRLSELSRRYLGEDRICLKGDGEALAQLTEAPAPRTLIIGVEKDFVPLSYAGEEQYMGMSVEIGKAIGELLGWEIRIQAITGDEIGTQLSSGNIDCALGFGTETIKTSAFTVGACFMKCDIVIAVPTESKVRSLRALDGEKIGSVMDPSLLSALKGSDKVAKYVDSVTAYLTPTRCINALGHGWCGAVAMDELMLQPYR